MGARDLPQNGSLDEGREAPGRARTPAELLDNLRLRLSELPESHPSAVRRPVRDTASDSDGGSASDPDGGRRGGSAREPLPREARGADLPEAAPDVARPADVTENGSDRRPESESESEGQGHGEGVAEEPADGADDQPAGGGGSLADLIRAVKGASDALAPSGGDMSALGEFDLFRGSGGADPYRPWFMDGEPGTPWFADDL